MGKSQSPRIGAVLRTINITLRRLLLFPEKKSQSPRIGAVLRTKFFFLVLRVKDLVSIPSNRGCPSNQKTQSTMPLGKYLVSIPSNRGCPSNLVKMGDLFARAVLFSLNPLESGLSFEHKMEKKKEKEVTVSIPSNRGCPSNKSV